MLDPAKFTDSALTLDQHGENRWVEVHGLVLSSDSRGFVAC